MLVFVVSVPVYVGVHDAVEVLVHVAVMVTLRGAGVP
jgi:hypothetical protein